MKNKKPTYKELLLENEKLKELLSDRKNKTDNELIESELNHLFELIPDMICIASTDGYFKRLNKEWEKVLGYSIKELMSKPFAEFIHPDDVEPTIKEVERQLNNQPTLNFVNRYRCKNGGYKWLDWVAIPSPDGKSLYAAARNITEKKQIDIALINAKDKIENCAKKFRLLTETMKDVVVKISTTGELLYVSPAAEKFGGYKPEEEIENNISKYFAKENDYHQAVKLIKEIVETHKSGNFEFLFKPKNKVPFPVELTFVPLISNNKVYAIQTVLRDITDRKKTEQDLKESEEKYRRIIENMQNSYFRANKHGVITMISPSALKHLVYSRKEELIGKFAKELYYKKEDREAMLVNIAKKGKLKNYEIKMKTKKGELLYTSLNIQIVLDNEGKPDGIEGIVENITERKLAELALNKSDELMTSVIEGSLDAIIAINDKGNIIVFNSEAQDLFQYTEEEALNQPVKILLRKQHGDNHQMKLERYLNKGYGRCGHIGNRDEKIFQKKDGSVFMAEVSMSGGRRGKFRLIVLTIHDITERKLAEQALKKSEKALKEAQKIAKIGSWSYDLNKPDKIFWNENLCSMHGIKIEDFDQKFETTITFLHPDDKERVLKTLQLNQIQKQVNKCETRIITKDGVLKYMNFIPKIVLDDKGEVEKITGIIQDITERKKAEQVLKESEAKLKERVKELQGIFSLGLLTEKYEKLNDIYTEFVNKIVPLSMKYTDKVYISLEIENIIYSNIKNYHLPNERKYLSANIYVFKKQVGKLIVSYTENLPIDEIFEQKLINAYAERISNITERKKAEQALKESEEKFSKVFELSLNAFLLTRIDDGKLLDINQGFTQMFGYTKAETKEKTALDLNIWLNIEDRKRAIEILLQKGILQNKETKSRTKSGKIIDVLLSAIVIKIKNELVILGELIDITDRKKAEQALKQSEEKYRIVADFTYDWEYWVDIDGNFIYVSPSCKRITGYSFEEFIQNPNLLKSIIYPNDANIFENHKHEVRGADLIKPIDFRIITKNKEVRWINHLCQTVYDSTGKNLGKRGSNRDITERIKAEQALKESEAELRESNKTKDKFFSIIAHDLRSPFNSMLGFSELLDNEFDKFDPKQRKHFIGIIHQGLQNTFKLLENLLLWSRSQSGVIDFKPEKINLYLISTETCKLLNQFAENKSIKLINKISENIHIKADKDMLSTIIRNLVSNAIKFTHKEGEISIETEIKQQFIEITVKDNGIGISKEIQSKLFDIGENTSIQGTENETGTGLGLILCKEFVEKNGGKIWIESEEGKGSKFIFSMPCCPTV